jgi:hypothetical protein
LEVPNVEPSESSLVQSYLQGDQVPRARLQQIIEAECLRIQDEGVDLVPDLVLRILDRVRPVRARGRRGPGRKATS